MIKLNIIQVSGLNMKAILFWTSLLDLVVKRCLMTLIGLSGQCIPYLFRSQAPDKTIKKLSAASIFHFDLKGCKF